VANLNQENPNFDLPIGKIFCVYPNPRFADMHSLLGSMGLNENYSEETKAAYEKIMSNAFSDAAAAGDEASEDETDYDLGTWSLQTHVFDGLPALLRGFLGELIQRVSIKFDPEETEILAAKLSSFVEGDFKLSGSEIHHEMSKLFRSLM
jgi:hypothetical protein